MGVILNPIAYRVGYKHSWLDAWYAHRSNYSAFLHNVLSLKLLIHFIFFRYFVYRKNHWMYSHLNIYMYNNKIFINLYLYDANKLQLYYDASRGFRRIAWTRLHMVSAWFKGNLFDRRGVLKKFAYLTRIMRFFFDFIGYEDLSLILMHHNRTFRKIKHLKKKNLKVRSVRKRIHNFSVDKKKNVISLTHDDELYNEIKHSWMSWEEISPYELPFYYMSSRFNSLSIKWWTTRFNIVYKKALRKYTSPKTNIIKSNSRLLFTFLFFFNKILEMLNPAYDKFNFDRKVVRKILKFFVFFF